MSSIAVMFFLVLLVVLPLVISGLALNRAATALPVPRRIYRTVAIFAVLVSVLMATALLAGRTPPFWVLTAALTVIPGWFVLRATVEELWGTPPMVG